MEDFTAEDPAAEKSGGSPVLTETVLTAVYRSLIAAALLLVLVLLAGSVWAVFSGRSRAADRKNPVSGAGTALSGAPGNIFTGIGRLRLSTADSLLVILSVNFPYPPEDRPFSEELVSRTMDFRAAAAEYFRRFRAEEIGRMDEEKVKADLLEQFNSILRLGKIEILYFSEYLVLD